MNNNELYKSMMAFTQAYKDVLAPLNQRLFGFFESDAMKSALSKMGETAKRAAFQNAISPALQESLLSIKDSYSNLAESIDFGQGIGESIKPIFADFHVNTMFQLSRTARTEMTRSLTSCFANAQYEGAMDVLNQALKAKTVMASDVAFIKTSDYAEMFASEISFPRGMVTSLKALNKVTANDIANNTELRYDTETQQFISAEGEINSKGLNVVCSGKTVFNSIQDELFSENELIDFCSFLSRTPMLAFKSDTGQKIYDFLKELFFSGEKSIDFDHEIYYHCRSHKITDQAFTYDQMLKAPHGLPWLVDSTRPEGQIIISRTPEQELKRK